MANDVTIVNVKNTQLTQQTSLAGVAGESRGAGTREAVQDADARAAVETRVRRAVVIVDGVTCKAHVSTIISGYNRASSDVTSQP